MQQIEQKIANDVNVYHDTTTDEYIPLAKIPKMWEAKIDIPFYGPDIGPRLGMPMKEDTNDDYLMKIYIGSLGILGILILYKFYEKS
jgi:hypothetical protein